MEWCSCKPSSDGLSSMQGRLLFEQWRAKQLFALDAHFMATDVITHIMFGVKTARHLCIRGLSNGGWLWQAMCGNVLPQHSSSWLSNVPGVAWFRGQVNIAAQAILSPFLVSVAMNDWGVLLSLPGLVLWVLCICSPKLSEAYTRHPWLRLAVLLSRRFPKLIGCMINLTAMPPVPAMVVDLVLLQYMLSAGQYMYMFWQSAMTVVPFKVQLVSGFIEWAMTFLLVVMVKAAYPAAAEHPSALSTPVAFLLSLLVIYILPTALMAVMEFRHSRGYRAYLQWARLQPATLSGHSGSGDSSRYGLQGMLLQAQEQVVTAWQQYLNSPKQQQAASSQQKLLSNPKKCESDAAGSSTVNASSNKRSSSSSLRRRQHKGSNSRNSSGMSVEASTATMPGRPSSSNASISSEDLRPGIPPGAACGAVASKTDSDASSMLAAFAAVAPPAAELGLAAVSATAAAAADMPPAGFTSVLPRLEALIGPEGARDVGELFSSASSATCSSKASVQYQGHCKINTASIKVAAAHSDISTLGPLLQSSLITALVAKTGGSRRPTDPFVCNSVCFPGCVQLLAHIIGPATEMTQSNVNSNRSSNSTFGSSSSTGVRRRGVFKDDSAAAEHLLQLVKSSLADQAAAVFAHKQIVDDLSARSATAAADGAGNNEGVPPVSVLWGHVFAGSEEQQAASATAIAAAPAASVGAEQANNSSSSRASAGTSAAFGASSAPTVAVVRCTPACIVADQASKLEILTTGLALGQYRLLVHKSGHAFVDSKMEVSGAAIDVDLPAMEAGVVHLTLLPAQGPLQNQLRPALRETMLVLPTAAAAEMKQVWQWFWQTTVAAAAAEAVDSKQQQLQQQLWQGSMGALATDVAYLLGPETCCGNNSGSARSSSSTDGQNDVLLTGHHTSVLRQLSVFLAANKCWETLKFVVDATWTATTQAAAPATTAAAVVTAGRVPARILATPPVMAEAPAVTQAVAPTALSGKDAGCASMFEPEKAWRLCRYSTAIEKLPPAAHIYIAHQLSGNPHIQQAGQLVKKQNAAAAASDQHVGTGSSSADKVAVEPGTCSMELSSSSCCLSLAGKQVPSAAAPPQQHSAEVQCAAQMELASAGWITAARQLLRGFRSHTLEQAYLQCMTRQTSAADSLAAVYHIAIGLGIRPLCDPLRSNWSEEPLAWVIEAGSRLLFFLCVCLPSILVVALRKRLVASGRREEAVIACEWVMAFLPLAGALGIIKHGHTWLGVMATGGTRLSMVMFWGAGCFKAGCRQVRTPHLLLPVMIESFGAGVFARSLGVELAHSLLKYGGVLLAGVLTATFVEVNCRQAFLQWTAGQLASTSTRAGVAVPAARPT